MSYTAKIRVTRPGGVVEYLTEYDATTQPDYALKYGINVQSGEPQVLLHTPDLGEPIPVAANEPDKIIFLTMNILSGDDDDMLDALMPLKRALDGSTSQALRQTIGGRDGDVACRLQLENATNYTDWIVKWGWVDDSRAYYSEIATANQSALNVVIMLQCRPAGEGATISLNNDLASSPHFVEDSDADGLADGWNVDGSPTTSIETTRALIGGKSQKVVTSDDSSAEGIRSDDVTASTSSDGVCYAWISADSGSCDTLTLMFRDGSGNLIDQVQFNPSSPANYDRLTTDEAGNYWYRYSASGSNSTAANMRLMVQRAASGASQISTFYVDGCYLEVGTTTAPDAWCSSNAWENRYDPTLAENNINYIDFWGIPGDAPAYLHLKATATAVASNPTSLIASKTADNEAYAVDHGFWVESDDISGSSGTGSFSTPADASRSNGSYERYTEAGAPGTALLTATIPNAVNFHLFPRRIFVIARSSSAATTIQYSGATGGPATINPVVAFTNPNVWELLDLGVSVPVNTPISLQVGAGTPAMVFSVSCGASVTFDIDAVLFLPAADDGFLLGTHSSSLAATDIVHVIGKNKRFYTDNSATSPTWLGSCWEILPGEHMTRIVLVSISANNVHDLTDAHTVQADIIPRTRHLLGTR